MKNYINIEVEVNVTVSVNYSLETLANQLTTAQLLAVLKKKEDPTILGGILTENLGLSIVKAKELNEFINKLIC